MWLRRIVFILPLAAALIGPPAWAQSTDPQTISMSSASGSKSPADQAMKAGMTKMNQNMSGAPMTGDPDQDFVSMMIPHHHGAVSMAEVELHYGHDPFLHKLAKEIIAAQDKEIAEMREWQQQHPNSKG